MNGKENHTARKEISMQEMRIMGKGKREIQNCARVELHCIVSLRIVLREIWNESLGECAYKNDKTEKFRNFRLNPKTKWKLLISLTLILLSSSI